MTKDINTLCAEAKSLSEADWRKLMDYEAGAEYSMAMEKHKKLLTLWSHSNQATQGFEIARQAMAGKDI
jgi:hypothetical protein